MRLPVAATRDRVAAAGPPTLGVEEEYALLEPQTGRVALVAPDVIRDCHELHGVVAESMTYMVEVRTPVCRTLDDVQSSLRASRLRLAMQARRHGAALVASAALGVSREPGHAG